MENTFTVKLSDIISAIKLDKLYIPENCAEDGSDILITTSEVNRPGLALTGYLGSFASNRIQLIGRAEYKYLEGFSHEKRLEKVELFFQQKIPTVIITHGLDCFPEILYCAQKYETPLLKTDEQTSALMSALISYLSVMLAPRITRHGVLVEVYGEGILMIGESGVGKSETAVELLKRGHRLVADDAVEIKRVSDRTLVGSSPVLIRHLIELRGIGIVDVRQIFGMGAVKESEKIDLVIQLEQWNEASQYDRLGLDCEYYEILGLKIPSITIPIKPGRNLAIIIEVASMNSRLKRLGYNAAEEFNKRLNESMGIDL